LVADDYQRLYDTYHTVVEKFVALHVRRRARQQEICQDTWEAVFKAMGTFRNEANEKTWILSIARHKAIDSLRRSIDPAPRAAEPGEQSESLLSGLGLARPRTPASLIEAKERAGTLRRVLDGFEPEERELLHLRFVMELKPAEIVRVLGIDVPPNTISQRLVRLVRRAVEALKKEEAFRSR
jgi:RNA polymerase sigma-70 factor (ECF subfamily)